MAWFFFSFYFSLYPWEYLHTTFHIIIHIRSRHFIIQTIKSQKKTIKCKRQFKLTIMPIVGCYHIEYIYIYMNTAFGQATLTIPGANISIPLSANQLGNLTAHNATNQTTGQTGQNQQTQSQQNQSANQATANQNASNQQNQQSVNFVDELCFVCGSIKL